MQALFITYRVGQVTPAEHAELCAQLAPAFAAVPGLVSLTWLTDDTTRRRAGFYVFADRPSFDAFVASELYEALCSHHAVDLNADEYSVDEVPTAITGGVTAPSLAARDT
jgi:Putative mono-oxygenase ydhR